MVIKKDYVERMIEQLAAAIARLLKLREAGHHGEALAVVRTACEEAFGLEYGMLVGVDAASAASLLGTPTKVKRFAELVRAEAAGEVQTPLQGNGTHHLRLGDRVWMRYAKAGEMCERFNQLHLVQGDRLVDTAPTYRGEGRNFG